MIQADFMDGKRKTNLPSTIQAIFMDGKRNTNLPSMIQADFMDGNLRKTSDVHQKRRYDMRTGYSAGNWSDFRDQGQRS